MTTHPAKFSDPILDVLGSFVTDEMRVLDPFAGTGRVHSLRGDTVGIEIEPEWADLHERTLVGDALDLPFSDSSFDAIVTSPCYGNRMADKHEAKDSSRRLTYRHSLGRPLHPRNAGGLQWGAEYRRFHRDAWREALRVLRPGGLFLLNVSDHVRAGRVQPVAIWHVGTIAGFGCDLDDLVTVPTRRMRFGENAEARVPYEIVAALRKR